MNQAHKKIRAQIIYVSLIAFGLCFSIFFSYRYGGQWIETDTATMNYLIANMQSDRTLTPLKATYPHGFLFQAFSMLLLDLSGLDLSLMLTRIYPFISIILLISAAWYLFSQAGNDVSETALAVLLLCFQSEVLFVIFRGSHEKLDWPLMMLSLSFLFKSLKSGGVQLAFYIFLFYLVAFAQISINVYFASTFLTAILLSLLIGMLIFFFQSRKKKILSENPVRLLYIALLVGVLLFVFIFYLYLPALENIRTTETIYQLLLNLLFKPESVAQPYDYIDSGWINSATYVGVSIFTWLLIVGSMIIWFWRAWRLLRGQDLFRVEGSLDWLLYAGFAIQVGASILIDFSGALGGNLQLRVFPGFTVMAVLLLSKGLVRLFRAIEIRPFLRTASNVLLIILVAWLAIAGLLKASNEPLLSNQWMIYSEAEVQAIDWGINHLENTKIWTGVTSRVKDAFSMRYDAVNDNVLSAYDNYLDVRHIVYSQKDILRAERAGFSLPPVFGWMWVYDNGEVQLYTKPPATPFQK